MDQRDDWTWSAWPRSRLRRTAVLVLAGLALIGTGAGLALVVTGLTVGSSSPRAGLYAVSLPKQTIATEKIARAVDPAVVDINTVIESPSGPANVAGTGMILTSNGDIVTNNHVIEDSTVIKVGLPNHHEYAASFVGADPAEDVAVIHIDARHLPTVVLGNSSGVQVGQSVLAIGNALGLGGTPSVTAGAVSALDRSITATSETGADSERLVGMIESDAPIAPGNSGGPLVDGRGRVIGMNTAAAPSGSASARALAFAIPIERVSAIAHQIEAGRRASGIDIGRSAYLGIEGMTMKLVDQTVAAGVNIVQVEPGTPASAAGMEPGDLILGFGEQRTTSMGELSRLIDHCRPGSLVTVNLEAGGVERNLQVRLVAGPAP